MMVKSELIDSVKRRRKGAKRKKSEELTSLLFCHRDKGDDGDSQWTQITFNYNFVIMWPDF